MLPQLAAERQLLAIEAAAVPHWKPQAQSEVIRRLSRRASDTRARTLGEALAAAPIPIEFVPKPTRPVAAAEVTDER